MQDKTTLDGNFETRLACMLLALSLHVCSPQGTCINNTNVAKHIVIGYKQIAVYISSSPWCIVNLRRYYIDM